MVKWSVKIFFDRELHRMHLRKSSLQNSSALVQTLFLQKSTEKSLLIPMRSIKSAQCYISRTMSRRQKFFCENRPIFGMVRDAEVRGGENINDFLFVCADFCCDTLNRFDWERKKSGYGYLQRRCDLSICACISRNSRLICLSAFHFLLL